MAAHCSGCVFTVCVCSLLHFGWVKCRARIPSMGHHMSICHFHFNFRQMENMEALDHRWKELINNSHYSSLLIWLCKISCSSIQNILCNYDLLFAYYNAYRTTFKALCFVLVLLGYAWYSWSGRIPCKFLMICNFVVILVFYILDNIRFYHICTFLFKCPF